MRREAVLSRELFWLEEEILNAYSDEILQRRILLPCNGRASFLPSKTLWQM